MTDLGPVLGLGGEIKVGELTYTWTPMTLQAQAEMEGEIRAALGVRLDILPRFKAAIEGMANAGDRKVAIEAAIREQMRIDGMNAFELAQEFRFPAIEVVMIRYHLKPKHPEITDAEVLRMFTWEHQAAIFNEILGTLRKAMPGESRSPNFDGGSVKSKKERTATAAKGD